MTTESYHNLIVGGGEAGKYLAWTLARQGQKTIVVERALIGGSCPNIACLPSKNVIHSAKVATFVRRAAEFGVTTSGFAVDMGGVFRRKHQMVEGLIELNSSHYQGSGTELVMGQASFVEPKTAHVALNAGGTRTIRGDRVFLNVGTHATIPDTCGLAEAKPLTHIEALNLKSLPAHLVVLGGGYVGLEFAQAMRRFGSRVTIVQRGPQLLPREDLDVADALARLMREEGIDVLLKADVLEVSGLSGEKVQLRVRAHDAPIQIEASHILVAAGRTPNTAGLDLDKAGVQLDSRGYIQVNERLQTSAPDVWAMGECAGSPQFTHVSFDDYRIVRDNLASGNRTTRDRLVPFCLFTDPELARVGLNESEAQARKLPYRLATLPMAAVLRTRTLSETRGFMKALVGEKDRLLGFTAFGAEASELMAAAQVAILGSMPYTVLRDAIFTHPTAAEGFSALFANPPK
jgi:pyruvate/2-oxoglutarate dehydrogenase complex dihydrolipoamide dehydrogenase (E3) component